MFAIVKLKKVSEGEDTAEYEYTDEIIGYISAESSDIAFKVALQVESSSEKDFESFTLVRVNPEDVRISKGQFVVKAG